MSPAAHAATNTAAHAAGTRAVRLHSSGKLLVAQIRYQVRLLISSGRAIAVGVGLPVILLVASKGKGTRPDVAGYAVFGLTITARSTYGVRLVAAREDGVLKRWRATPLPRWCYFLGRILATALVAVLAGAVTVAAAMPFYGSHFGDGPGTQLTVTAAFTIVAVLFLGAFAWAATATALTGAIPTVEAAFPTLIFIYFPVIIISGVLLTNLSEPQWLSTFATYLPAQPLIDAVTRSVRHTSGAPFLCLTTWVPNALTAGLLADTA
jgi:ABC-2 type transport system permease protein